MGLMGMGWLEITVIVVAAILVFGPDKLPEVASQAGKLLRDIRNMTADMTGEFEKQTGVNPMDLRAQVEKEMSGVKSSFDQAAGGVTKELNSTANSLKSTTAKSGTAKKPAALPAGTSTAKGKTTTTTAKAGSSSSAKVEVATPKASKNDPFADVSFLDNPGETPPVSVAKPEPVKPATNGNGSAANANGATTEPAGEVADAIARARQRRADMASQSASASASGS